MTRGNANRGGGSAGAGPAWLRPGTARLVDEALGAGYGAATVSLCLNAAGDLPGADSVAAVMLGLLVEGAARGEGRRLAEIVASPGAAGRLAALALACPVFLARAGRQTVNLEELADEPRLRQPRTLGEYGSRLAGVAARAGAEAEFAQGLRAFRYAESMRIAAREVLDLAPFEVTAGELSDLASACVEAAAAYYYRVLAVEWGRPRLDARVPHDPACATPGFAVLGLGKLGGRELNFSSDIDLICLYASDDGEVEAVAGRKPVSLHAWYEALAGRMARCLHEMTPDGFVFRVDFDLRPEGKNGPVVNSLDAMLDYYESWGATWERAALLKHRVIAGDKEAGGRFSRGIFPFVFRAGGGPGDQRDLVDMKRRAEKLALARNPEGIDLKVGAGGIREIEFYAQSWQLRLGAAQARLRAPGTLAALAALAREAVITSRDHAVLADAYIMLRRLENAVQMHQDQQTQRLPRDPERLAAVAHTVGFRKAQRGDEPMMRRLEQVRAAVRTYFESLGQPSEESEPSRAALLAADPDTPAAERAALLAELGIGMVDGVAILDSLARIPTSPFHPSNARQSLLAAELLDEISRCPQPWKALARMLALHQIMHRRQGLRALVGRMGTFNRRLITLFGTSDVLSDSLLNRPHLIMPFLGPHAPAGPPVLDKLFVFQAGLGDAEAALHELKAIQQWATLSIGLADLGGAIDVQETGALMTTVADRIVTRALALARVEMVERHGAPLDGAMAPAMAVMAMGKYGSREAGYFSDLDLIFVFEGEGETAGGPKGALPVAEFFTRCCQRFLSFLSMPLDGGPLYAIDTALRPSGNQGPLITSLESFRRYHEERAQLWERQALLRARFMAGDEALGARIGAVIGDLVEHKPVASADGQQVHRLRQRLEAETSGETSTRYHIKAGRGGLLDAEFIVQWLVLAGGKRYQGLRPVNTLQALDALEAAGDMRPADARMLRESVTFLRRLDMRLKLLQGSSEARHLSRRPERTEVLARSLGFTGDAAQTAGAALIAMYERCAAANRALFKQYVPGG